MLGHPQIELTWLSHIRMGQGVVHHPWVDMAESYRVVSYNPKNLKRTIIKINVLRIYSFKIHHVLI